MAKKNIQPQETTDVLAQSEAFVIKYKKAIIIGLVALLALVALIFGCRAWLSNAEEKGQSQITLGLNYLISNQPDYDKALKGDGKFQGFLKLAQGHFTDASNLAKAYAGICYASKADADSSKTQQADLKNAIKYLEDFSPKADNTLTPAVISLLANCYANNGQVDKAIDTFKKAAKKADNSDLSPEYLIQAGELLLSQKKNAEAKKVFESIKEDYPASRYCTPNQSPDGTTVTDPVIDTYIAGAAE